MAALLLLAVVVAPAVVRGQENQRSLTILEPEEPLQLDPAFEMIMEKMDNDLKYILSAPFRLTPKGTAIAGITVLTTLFFLEMDEEYLADISSEGGEQSERTYNRLRVLGRHVPEITAGLYLLGYFMDNDTIKSRSLEGLEAVAFTALVTATSAFFIGHAPPDEGIGSNEYRWFSDYRSMPDINAALVFSLASVLAYEQKWPAQLLYYSVAAGTGASRIHDQEAWPSDVFLGAVIGTVVGRTVSSLSRKSGDNRVSARPIVVVGGRPATGLGLTWKL